MKKLILLLFCAGIILSLSACGLFDTFNLNKTRKEEDVYTITMRDTTREKFVNNAPGNRDNGVIVPSSVTFKSERDMLQYDSVTTREYPDYIRYGLFESIGMIGSSSKNKIGTGIFGVFPGFDNFRKDFYGTDDALFPGGIYRIGIVEKRLRWFQDAENWTWGTNVVEIIAPNALTDNTLMTIFPIYIRKRYYLREEIPYIALTPAVGIGWIPYIFSNYINASGSIEIGSIGGVNVRAFLGLVAGVNTTNTQQVIGSNNPKQSVSQFFPYLGLGVSVLDFHNLVRETEKEWKDHEHSSWNVGLLQFSALGTGADYTAFSTDTLDKGSFIKGMAFKLANASIAIPLLNNQFYAGTSLLNLMVFGRGEWGLSVLPIRVGYWQTILMDELSTEPFIELNYYPSSFFNIGNRINLALSEMINFSFVVGFASGSTDLGLGSDLSEEIGLPGKFSRPYIGIGIGLWDRIFFPQQLRYNKVSE